MLPGQHVLQVCHHVGDHGPQCRAEVHLSGVLNGHGVALAVVEPKVTTVCHMEAGTWMRDGEIIHNAAGTSGENKSAALQHKKALMFAEDIICDPAM